MIQSKLFDLFTSLRRTRDSEKLYSAKQFNKMIENERARVDRNQHEFSLIVFEMAKPEIDSDQVQRLAHTLTNRKRSVDKAGWLDNQHIGILLPYTSSTGAWKLADDVFPMFTIQASPPKCAVYTYPTNWFSNGSGDSDQPDFHDISAQFKTTMRGSFAVSKRSVDCENTGFTAGQFTSAAPQNHAESIEFLEPFLFKPLPFWKRIMDIIGSAVGLILFTPLMLAVGVAVKLSSPGRIFYKQKRMGYGGRPFYMYKYRTMIEDAEKLKANLSQHNEQSEPIFKMTNDPRITAIGRFLRKCSIDELPQLWNVLKGEMTLVGPRPPILDEVPQYETWQYRRLALTPGITCTWQINGRSEIKFEDWVRMDIRYAENRSLICDLKILLGTIPAVISQKGAR